MSSTYSGSSYKTARSVRSVISHGAGMERGEGREGGRREAQPSSLVSDAYFHPPEYAVLGEGDGVRWKGMEMKGS